MSVLMEAQGLEKSFHTEDVERPVLRGLSLAVDGGEWVAAMGPSGCGKSTMLHLLGGLDLPDAGSVRLGDDEITALDSKVKASDALVKQKDAEITALQAKIQTDAGEIVKLRKDFDAFMEGVEVKERHELAAAIIKDHYDPEAAKKVNFDSFSLEGLKQLKATLDLLPRREEVKDGEKRSIFPAADDKSPALHDMFKDERREYHGNVK